MMKLMMMTFKNKNGFPLYIGFNLLIKFHYDLVSLIMVDHNFKGRSQVRLEKRR